MTAAVFMVALAVVPSWADKEVTAAEKSGFLKLLAKLPHSGEFFTDEAVQQAVPHTRVLLALTPKDIEASDIYPFLALSSGLLERKELREYGVTHFGKIAHPEIKLLWGAKLFDAKTASPEVVTFLRAALESKEQAEPLSQMLGPMSEDFKLRLRNAGRNR